MESKITADRDNILRKEQRHCISEDGSGSSNVVYISARQQIKKQMYNFSVAEVDMNKTPNNKKSR